ncbi:MAG: transcriptional repressor LexA [Pseudomonadota bacterium]|nr:transcriptional repressor LexA [Pseudomonadota bacterium]
MRPLTPRQQQVLQFIRDFMEQNGMPPTRVEICKKLGFRSPNAAEEHLRALARKEAIELLPGSSRGIRLSESGGLPVVGQVAAGAPILAEEHIEERYRLPPALFHPRADYLLRVQGMSMRDAGILHNDLLAVHRTRKADNGRIVVARIGDEVTVKQLRHRESSHRVTLLPKNPDFSPIEIDLRDGEFTIEGIAVGVLRNGGLL